MGYKLTKFSYTIMLCICLNTFFTPGIVNFVFFSSCVLKTNVNVICLQLYIPSKVIAKNIKKNVFCRGEVTSNS